MLEAHFQDPTCKLFSACFRTWPDHPPCQHLLTQMQAGTITHYICVSNIGYSGWHSFFEWWGPLISLLWHWNFIIGNLSTCTSSSFFPSCPKGHTGIPFWNPDIPNILCFLYVWSWKWHWDIRLLAILAW